MITMRRLALVLGLGGLLYLSSCAPDKSDDPISPSSSDARDKYVSTWSCNEHSTLIGGNTTYTITISKSNTNSSEILISNFYQLGSTARASVSSSNFSIPYQQFGSTGFVNGGSGSISGNTIHMTYTMAIGADNDTCSATCTRQ